MRYKLLYKEDSIIKEYVVSLQIGRRRKKKKNDLGSNPFSMPSEKPPITDEYIKEIMNQMASANSAESQGHDKQDDKESKKPSIGLPSSIAPDEGKYKRNQSMMYRIPSYTSLLHGNNRYERVKLIKYVGMHTYLIKTGKNVPIYAIDDELKTTAQYEKELTSGRIY
jgi:hypothetical protein